MNEELFDISILGGGISCLASLKYLISINSNLKICIISSSKDISNKKVSKEYYKSFSLNHLKVSNNIKKSQIDKSILTSSIDHKLSILSTYNLGGLASFWGGGFFPSFDKNSISEQRQYQLIKKIFSIYEANKPLEKYNLSSFITKFKQLRCRFLINSNSKKYSFSSILDPKIEIEKICIKNNIPIFKDHFIEKLEYNELENNIKIISKNKPIFTKNILLGFGVFNTPKILLKSKIIKQKQFYFYDHYLYRIPLIDLRNIFFSQKNSLIRKSISSLETAFLNKNNFREIFLGIYKINNHINKNFPKFHPSIQYLIKKNILIFSQIFLSDKKEKFRVKGIYKNDNFYFEKINYSGLNSWDKVKIFFFYILRGYIPIPIKSLQKFGSSYHVHGSLKDLKLINLSGSRKRKCQIQIIDSSSVKEIESPPSSYLLIHNAIEKTKILIKKAQL